MSATPVLQKGGKKRRRLSIEQVTRAETRLELPMKERRHDRETKTGGKLRKDLARQGMQGPWKSMREVL